MLRAAGADVRTANGRVIRVAACERIELDEVDVPGGLLLRGVLDDAAATLVPGSELSCEASALNPTRTGLLRVLERMGADVQVVEHTAAGGEPVGDAVVRAAELRGTDVEPAEVPLDDRRAAAGRAAGRVRRGPHGRARRGGAAPQGVGPDRDGRRGAARRSGRGSRRRRTASWWRAPAGLRGGTLDAAGDHRLAMLGAIAGIASREGVEVRGFEAAGVSYPGFAEDLRELVERVGFAVAMAAGIEAARRRPRAGARSSSASIAAGGCSRWRLAFVLLFLLVRAAPPSSAAGRRSGLGSAAVPELPRGGREILPRNRVVAYYGAPQDPELGVLGTAPLNVSARRLETARTRVLAVPGAR